MSAVAPHAVVLAVYVDAIWAMICMVLSNLKEYQKDKLVTKYYTQSWVYLAYVVIEMVDFFQGYLDVIDTNIERVLSKCCPDANN